MYQNLKSEIISAMKRKELDTLKFLRYLDANIQNASIKLQKTIDNDLVIQTLKIELNKIKEEFENSIRYNKPEISKQKAFEENIIKKYLPKDLTEEEVKEKVLEIIKELNSTNFGLIMKTIKNKLGCLVDMNKISAIVKDLLK